LIVTLPAYCAAKGVRMDGFAEIEIGRVLSLDSADCKTVKRRRPR
jgi:hypothetical protein